MLSIAAALLLGWAGMNAYASNAPGEADGLVVVAQIRSATVEDSEIFANALGGNYIIDVETYTATGAPYLFTQWGALLGSVDPGNGGSVAEGTCTGILGNQDDFCIWSSGGTTAATNKMTVRIPASAIAWGAALPANGAEFTFVLGADGSGASLADEAGFLPAGNLNLVANQLAASGSFGEADMADEGFTPIFLLDSQPAGLVGIGNALLNPGFELGGPEQNAGALPESCSCQIRSAAAPWFLYADNSDPAVGNLAYSTSEIIVGGGPSGNALRVHYSLSDNGRNAYVGQHLPKDEQPGAKWVGSDNVVVEYDIRVTDLNGIATSHHGASTLHWIDGTEQQVTKNLPGGVAADGAWYHVRLDFGAVAAGKTINFFALSLNSDGVPAGSDLQIDYDNVQMKGVLLDGSELRGDYADGYAVHIMPYQASLAGASDNVAQRLVSFADGSTGYLYELSIYDFRGITPRVVDLNSDVTGRTFQMLDESYLPDLSHDPGAVVYSTSSFYSFDGAEGLSPRLLVAAPAALGGDVVVPWFYADTGADDDFAQVYGMVDPASGYHSAAKNLFMGSSVADQMDYAVTDLVLTGATGANVGSGSSLIAGCIGGPMCWPGAGQPITVHAEVDSASPVHEASTVDIVAVASGTVLASAPIGLPTGSADIVVPGSAMDALAASGDMKVRAVLNAGKFAQGALGGVIDVANLLPTADFSLGPAGTLTSLTTITVTDASSDPDGTIAFRDWQVHMLSDPTPDGDADTPALVAAGSGTFLAFSVPDDGLYAVNLTVIDDDGGEDWKNETFSVANIAPVASFLVDRFAQPGLVSFTDLSGDADGVITQADWTIGGTQVLDPGASFTYPLPTEGDFSVVLQVTDNDGALSAAASRLITIDGTAPVTTATVDGTAGTDGWYTGAVTVGLEGTDAASGVATTRAVIDGVVVGTSSGGAALSVSVSRQGETTVQYQSIDRAGNAESESGTLLKSETVRIDSVAPDLEMTNPDAIGALGSSDFGGVFVAGTNITVDVTVFEATSGVSAVHFALDGEPVGTDADGSDGWSFDIVTDDLAGFHDLLAFAFDGAGNLGTTPVRTVFILNTDVDQTLCGVEDPALVWDGSCEGDDYRNPTPEDATDFWIATRDAVMCSMEDNNSSLDGRCREDGHWVLVLEPKTLADEANDKVWELYGEVEGAIPGIPPLPITAGEVIAAIQEQRDALMCGEGGLENATNPADGECDGNGHYTVPQNIGAIRDWLLGQVPPV